MPGYSFLGKRAHSNAVKEAKVSKLTLEKCNHFKAQVFQQLSDRTPGDVLVGWLCCRGNAAAVSSDSPTTLDATVGKPLTTD